jgi:hypothetical protein
MPSKWDMGPWIFSLSFASQQHDKRFCFATYSYHDMLPEARCLSETSKMCQISLIYVYQNIRNFSQFCWLEGQGQGKFGTLTKFCQCLYLSTSKFRHWNPNPWGDGIRKRGLWEVVRSQWWSLVSGISAFIKETPGSHLTLLPTWGSSQ